MSDDALWSLFTPKAALICAAGTLTFTGWLILRRIERQIDLMAGDVE